MLHRLLLTGLLIALLPTASGHIDPASALQLNPGPIQEYLFNKGKGFYEDERLAAAVEVWEHILPDSLYGPVAYILSARAYDRMGKPEQAESILKEFLDKHERSPYRSMAKEHLLEVLCEQGRPEARGMISKRLSNASTDEVPYTLLQAARLARELGDKDKAVEHYRTLFLEYPATVPGLAATEELAWMVFLGKAPVPKFSESEQQRRARLLYRSGRFDLAADAYRKLLEADPTDLRLQLKLARCLYKNRQNHEAIATLKSILSHDLPVHTRMEATHLLSLLYWRLDRNPEFRRCCEALIEQGSRSIQRKALFNLGAHYLELGRLDKAEKYFDRVLDTKPGRSMSAAILWKKAWIHYLQDRYEEAAKAFRRTRALSVGSKMNAPTAYWEARSLIRCGHKSRAMEMLKKLAEHEPLRYYGLQAQRVLSECGVSLDLDRLRDGRFPDVDLSKLQKSDPRITHASVLMDKGLHEFAFACLNDLPNFIRSTPAVAFLRAQAAYGAGAYRKAYDILAAGFWTYMQAPPVDAPREFIEIAFPRVHPDKIAQTARKHSVDPYLVWAVIRQESRYDADAVSPAGALGLMQVTPRATPLGKDRRLVPAKAIAEILDPQQNLAYGIGILADNLRSFKGEVVPAIAAYNADIRKVRQWVKRNGKLEPDEFIETIPYSETRLYVKKILAGYRAYTYLHRKKDLAGLW